MVSAVSFRSCPAPSKFRVWDFGGGPGLNFDLSRLSFHTPISGLVWANPTCRAAMANKAAEKPAISMVRRFLMFLLAACRLIFLDSSPANGGLAAIRSLGLRHELRATGSCSERASPRRTGVIVSACHSSSNWNSLLKFSGPDQTEVRL